MSMMFITAAVLMAVLLYCASQSFGAEPKPAISNLVVSAGPVGARVLFMLQPILGDATVWVCWGTEDVGESVIEWKDLAGWRLAGGYNNLPIGPMEPGTRYCVRVLAENRGGETWSAPVWVQTGELHRIEKKQVGTVVSIR